MGLQINTEQVGNVDQIGANPERVEPGHGMAIVTQFDEYADGGGDHDVYLEIISYSDQSQVGKVHKERIFMRDNSGKGWPMKVLTKWALSTAVWTPDQVEEMQRQNQFGDLETSEMVGRPVFIEIEVNDQNDRFTRIKGLGGSVFNLNDPKCKDWPKHKALFAQWAPKLTGGIRLAPPKPAASQGNGKPAGDPFATV